MYRPVRFRRTDDAQKKRPDGIKHYTGPAGGRGALKAVAVAIPLKAEQIVSRGAQTLLKPDQPDGFDCPSCAWPDPKHSASSINR